jgi:hypothetical protein
MDGYHEFNATAPNFNPSIAGNLSTKMSSVEITDHIRKIGDKEIVSKFRMNPGNFSGAPDEDISMWIKLYERACRVNGWTTDEEKGRYLSCFLTKAAAEWYNSIEDTKETKELVSYNFLKKELEKTFDAANLIDSLEFKLYSRKQGKHEPVSQYYHSMINLCRRANKDMPQASIIRHLLKGLQPHLMSKVALMANTNLETFLANALKAEEVFLFCPQSVSASEEINKKLDAILNRTPYTPTVDAIQEADYQTQNLQCANCKCPQYFDGYNLQMCSSDGYYQTE